jgi:predicted permease
MNQGAPPRLARVLLRIVRLGDRRAEIEADLLDLFAERAASRGLRYARRRYYGDVLSLWTSRSARTPSPRATGSRRDPMRELGHDVIYAMRLLRRSPAVVAIAILGLGLAIGVGTSVFTLLNAAALRPTGILDPSAVVRVLRKYDNGLGTSWRYAEYIRLREGTRSATPEAWLREELSFGTTPDGDTSTTSGVIFASGGYLGSLNGRTTLGRVLSPADDRPGADPVVVISHTLWSRTLSSDPAIVGRAIWLNGVRFTIVGVTARGFTGMIDANPAIWAPIATYHVATGGPPLDRNVSATVNVVVRLGSGALDAQARSELNAAAVALATDRTDSSEPLTGVHFIAVGESVNRADAAVFALVMAIVVSVIGLVLLLACVNVTNLLLASAVTRQRELGVRVALGASRWRIVRQLMTESLLLGLAGGACGLLFTVWLVPVLARIARVPGAIDLDPNLRVYLFLGLTSILAGLGAGVVPARHAMRDSFGSPLTGSSAQSGSSRRSRSSRSVLVGVQAAASLVLMVVAALLTRGMVRATQVDIGFDARQLLTVNPALARGRYDAAGAKAYWDVALDRVRALPGVQSASLAEFPPFGGGVKVTMFRNARGRYTIYHNDTRADYFATLGLRAVRGRTYTAAEAADRAPVAVISERLAEDYFSGENPVGQSLDRILEGSHATIVGVVSTAITARLGDLGSATIYQPMQDTLGAKMVVRSSGSPEALVQSIRSALHSLDPRARLAITLVSDGLERQLSEPRALATLAGALACLALALAVVGLYGVTAFVVGQRTQEIGVRMALGASHRDVMRLLLRDSLRPVLFGLLAGVAAALLAGRALAGALFGVPPADPLAFGSAILVLVVAATGAVIFPTRRASAVDPAAVLRQL